MDELNLDQFYFDEESFIKNELKDMDLSGLTGGKQLRARLVALMGSITDLHASDLVKLGRTVELVHNATLTHDDVIDNSHTRRNAPSIPQLINNKKSVLLGDYMLAKSLHELSEFQNPKLTQELTLTLKDLVEGEWIQFENTNPYEITKSLYERLAVKKTGSLFRWCFVAPIVAQKSQGNIYDLLCEFGEQLGLIFQISDDLIDFSPESKKSYGLDFKNNNINYVLMHFGNLYPELKNKLLITETIEDLDQTQRNKLLKCVNVAKEDLAQKVEHCFKLNEQIKEKLGTGQALYTELNDILSLMKSRVY